MKFISAIYCLVAAGLFTACTQTDYDTTAADTDMLDLTITARIPDQMAGARSATVAQENAIIQRYVLETYEVNGTGNETFQSTDNNLTGIFTYKLDRKKSYRFYCWADGGSESAYDITGGLKNVKIKSGHVPEIAHRGASDVIAGENPGNGITIEMKHAVAKLVLMTTQPLKAGAVTAQTSTYMACNALTCAGLDDVVSITSAAGPDAMIIDASPANPVEVLSMYIMAGAKEAFSVTLRNSALQDASRTIDNVPFAADCRTLLKGDVTSINNYNVTLSATLDSNWNPAQP